MFDADYDRDVDFDMSEGHDCSRDDDFADFNDMEADDYSHEDGYDDAYLNSEYESDNEYFEGDW